MTIQCDRIIEARRPDIVVLDKKEKEVKIIDIAIPGDCRVKDKEFEKIEKYQMLKEEIRRLWNVKKVSVIPIVIGALGAVGKDSEKLWEKTELNIRLEIVQKTALLGTARILRKVLAL